MYENGTFTSIQRAITAVGRLSVDVGMAGHRVFRTEKS
jgi:hypothetical protein